MNSPFKILVVDDNRSLAEALGDVFEAKGFEPALAFDGDGEESKKKSGCNEDDSCSVEKLSPSSSSYGLERSN